MTTRIRPQDAFERVVVDDQERAVVPTLLHDTHSFTIEKPRTQALTFAPQPGLLNQNLAELTEDGVLSRVISVEQFRRILAASAGLSGPAWFLLGTMRQQLLPGTTGKPGDFDVIVGPVRDGLLAFDEICAIEVKLRKLGTDGSSG